MTRLLLCGAIVAALMSRFDRRRACRRCVLAVALRGDRARRRNRRMPPTLPTTNWPISARMAFGTSARQRTLPIATTTAKPQSMTTAGRIRSSAISSTRGRRCSGRTAIAARIGCRLPQTAYALPLIADVHNQSRSSVRSIAVTTSSTALSVAHLVHSECAEGPPSTQRDLDRPSFACDRAGRHRRVPQSTYTVAWSLAQGPYRLRDRYGKRRWARRRATRDMAVCLPRLRPDESARCGIRFYQLSLRAGPAARHTFRHRRRIQVAAKILERLRCKWHRRI